MVNIYGSGIGGFTNTAIVTDAGELLITGSVTTEVTIGAVTAGSESFLFGISGGDWMPLAVVSGTEAILRTDVSVSVGSESVIVGGSIQTYTQLGSVEVWQTTNSDMQVQVTQETSPWVVSGTATVTNFGVLGSSRVIEEVSPLDSSQNNALLKLEYVISGTSSGVFGSEIGSVVQFIGVGSFVKVITYNNNVITQVGSWS